MIWATCRRRFGTILLRLGWSHGDDEIISTDEAVAWFDLPGIGRAPARIDFAKLASVNGHYIRSADDACLIRLVMPVVAEKLGSQAVSRCDRKFTPRTRRP